MAYDYAQIQKKQADEANAKYGTISPYKFRREDGITPLSQDEINYANARRGYYQFQKDIEEAEGNPNVGFETWAKQRNIALPGSQAPDSPTVRPAKVAPTASTPGTQNPTTIAGAGGFQATRTIRGGDTIYEATNPDGSSGRMVVHGGANNMREPGSHFRGGYDPAAARNYQQIGANTYMNDRGLMIQGNQADADYIYRFRHGASTPIFTPAPQQQAQAQMQMPQAPGLGWKSKLRGYEAQMRAYDNAQNRALQERLAQAGDARAAEQLGFQQEQARQQMELARMGHGLQAGHLANETAKAAWEQEAAAMGLEHQRALLGARQRAMKAFASGTPEEQAAAMRELQILTAGDGKSGKSNKTSTPKIQQLGDVWGIMGDDGKFHVPQVVYSPEDMAFKEQLHAAGKDVQDAHNALPPELQAYRQAQWLDEQRKRSSGK